jgi:hypothetical protein
MLNPASILGVILLKLGLNKKFKKHDSIIVWAPWFAWFPVIINSRIFWCKFVERKFNLHSHSSVWIYREHDQKRLDYEEKMRKEREIKPIEWRFK